MSTRKKSPAKKLASLAGMLAHELGGESPPVTEQLALMVRGAMAVNAIAPWEFLEDGHVYAFDSDSGQRWYCTVMGALGEAFAIQAYRGDHGFALHRDVSTGRVKDSASFLARQDVFTIDFVRRVELKPIDRAILELSNDPVPAGIRVPLITVSRPMQMRWYPNAAEVSEINDCLMASLLFFEWLAAHPSSDPWKEVNQLPLLKDWATGLKVTKIAYPARPEEAMPAPGKLDERRLNQLMMSMPQRKPGPPLEVDVFLLLSSIRGESRPYFPWTALACNSRSGTVFPPIMGTPADKREDLLLLCTLRALEDSPFRPAEFRVADEFNQAALEPLAQALDIPVKIATLNAVSEARVALEAHVRA